MLKESTKRRRTRAQIEEEKKEENKDDKDKAEMKAQMEQLIATVKQQQDQIDEDKAARDLLNRFVVAGVAVIDGSQVNVDAKKLADHAQSIADKS